ASGCQTCHAGALLGGNMYQKIGVVKPWPDTSDPGRYQVTKNEADKFMFKVPSLRNIEKTGPYFHDGKIATLKEAIAKMADYQVGKTLSDADIQSIETWMKSLTGVIPADYIKQPELPRALARLRSRAKRTEGASSHPSSRAAGLAKYVRMIPAPARVIEVRVSIIARS